MATALDPLANPQAWDVVVIGGVTSPGKCDVGEFKRAFEWDQKKGKGAVGATITFVARPPAKGTIRFQLWTTAHFAAWDTFRQLLKYDPTKKAVQAVDIYHPSLAAIDITSVVVEELGNVIHEGDQLYSITIALLEYFPPPKASSVSTPTGSQSNAIVGGVRTTPGTPPPSTDDAYQQTISDLLVQAQQPFGGGATNG